MKGQESDMKQSKSGKGGHSRRKVDRAFYWWPFPQP